MINFKAAIFDLDGTLLNSMWIWERLLIDFLADLGYETPPEVLSKVTFMTLKQSSEYVRDEFNLGMTAKEICTMWTNMVYDFYAKKVIPKPGAEEYLKYLKENGIKIGIATACAKDLCEVALKNTGLLKYIDSITYADEVGRGKGSPEVYIESLRRLNETAENSMLYEDILTALRTGKSIGMSVTAVEDDCAKFERNELKNEADLYIKDFLELL
ncbi:MAG: HAD family phosphatase [Oscillospiraceae bacterium]